MSTSNLPRLTDEQRQALDDGYVAMAGVPVGEELPATLTHTQGPWIVKGVGVYAQPFVRETTIGDDDGTERSYTEGLVALVYSCGQGRMPGNAALIAAAPTMLTKLREIAKECGECSGNGVVAFDYPLRGLKVGDPCPQCEDIREVIAVAEGKQS
ncbi:MAG TPA: hypothetical protein VGD45_20420 [Steroidobacter sp.]|uniref:hypothetical protein n=1 Tax=Steroidobacter sp. TaxID=1978227 RepID=UPI002ED8B866